ncbi:MAG TPA: hypothetical protein VM802_31855 [Chitinophaga sp.]|uniref:hypothetical protein n=1 Tax=Chitinophaga sp. TaxID=1869181 RepID=UPI002C7B9358|nr:hypothetical protein [Chitinophaga sp.]HVI49505.1 hypothetical protein [Chitinophaga sp.]
MKKICCLFVMLMMMYVPGNSQDGIHHYLYISHGDLPEVQRLLELPEIKGVQIVYNWKDLEKAKGKYDFSAIEEALAVISKLHKQLFIQVQDRFFSPEARNIPAYLLHDAGYNGGLVQQVDNPGENKLQASGWVTQQWNPAVRARYQALLQALAAVFDGRIAGVNLPETSIDIDMKHDKTGFSCDKYFQAEIENMRFAKQVFKRSYVVQYVNFIPCEWNNDHQYMSRLFAAAEENKIGLGGPDIIPERKGQMKNSYPFFHRYKGRLAIVAMAVQEPTLTYTNPKTKKPFTKTEFVSYAAGYLGVNIIFWSSSTPWLKQAAAN